MKRVALILASGQGRRFGGPKALIEWEGVPLAVAHAMARSEDCERAVVVTRAGIAESLVQALAGKPSACPWHPGEVHNVTGKPYPYIVVSDEPDELGPAGSIAAAVKAGAIADADQVLVTPVDVPPASSEVVRALWEALDAGAQAARPRLNGRPGHPVVCMRAVLDGFRDQPRPLRDVLALLGAGCVAVEVSSPEVVVDFDTVEELRRWASGDRRPRP